MNTLIPMNHQQPLEEEDTIMNIKESFMLSSATGHTETVFRTAHFLKPVAKSNLDILNPSSSSSSVFESKECPFKIKFNGWRYPHKQWVTWVDQLKPKYESVWKKVGIFDAIMSTKSHIMKNQDLVYGVVEKWCSETNTFVFPFGEATITLEDVMVLGGYPILGDPVFTSLEDQEMREAEQKLKNARQEITKKSKMPSTSKWMKMFIGKGTQIEHDAFLATWLSIFVFPNYISLVKQCLFPIAVRLARGNTIALASTVLASLYRDLSLFKKQIVDLEKHPLEGIQFPMDLEVNIQSPFYLVQVWASERFKNLKLHAKLIENADHILFRWHNVKPLKVNNVKLALDSANKDDFLWRPYVKYADMYGNFYPKDEVLVPVKKDLGNKILSFVICLRVSELVGFDSIEQYQPHRVAMQFGFDQDIPGSVPRFNETITNAWNNYCRPISDKSVYFPSRCSEGNVTVGYEKWWKRSASSSKCRPANATDIPLGGTVTFGKPCDDGSKTSNGDNIVHDDVPPVFPPTKLVDYNITNGKHCGGESKTSKGDNISDDVPSDFVPKQLKSMSSENSVQDGLEARGNIDAGASSSLPPKQNTLTPLISFENCNHVLEDGNESKEARLSSDIICESGTQEGRYTNLCEVMAAELEERVSRLERVHRERKMARMKGR